VLQRISDLEKLDPVAQLTLTELANVRLRDSFREVPEKVTVKHQDAAKGKLVEMDVVDGKVVAVPSSVSKTKSSGDTAKNTSRATSAAVAAAQARAKMAKLQRQRCTASWTCMGRPELKSGSVVDLTGESAGRFAGRWLITRASHSIDRSSGFVTEIDACRVAANGQEETPE